MNKRVMIIDDDKEFLEELRETLTLSGYELMAVNDAAKAFDTAVNTKPAVIMLDLKMPGKSGFQVASELKSFSELEHVPIIAMTAYFKDDYVPLMELCGIKTYLKKPFNPLDAIARIEDALGEDQ